MRDATVWLGWLAMLFASSALAAVPDVQYGPAPAWAVTTPEPADGPTPDGAPLRVLYSDMQIHLGADGVQAFQALRVRILRPEGLAAGNLTLSWNPGAGNAIIHAVRIDRKGRVIDVLKSNRFRTVEREGAIENAILQGNATAVLEVPGLQVGDELEFAATVTQKDRTLGDHVFGMAHLPAAALPGAFRIRITWPANRPVHWRASRDVIGLATVTHDGQTVLDYALRDPRSAVPTDGAPLRFNIRRTLEYSDFERWSDVSQRLWTLFDRAATLSSDSPVRREIEKIAAENKDPAQRAQAALRLVQERIRYVYVGLDGGNYLPASADETWERRFGDCKAKAALLLAILRGLGIDGEAVLVNSQGGDGIDERLPTPAVFDHVVVRADLDGRSYWLDGTRLGDWVLTAMSPPPYRWVLPLRQHGSDLEHVPPHPWTVPDTTVVVDIDATSGFGRDASFRVRQLLHGDHALQLRAALMTLPPEDADRAIRTFWRQWDADIQPDAVGWRYDAQHGVLVLSLRGKGRLQWTGDDTSGRSLDIFDAGFTPPAEYHRPDDQDQTAPWSTNFPAYHCYATSIHLPPDDARWRWDYYSDPVNTYMGGVHYWRVADLRGGIMRTVMSTRVETPEISAAQAADVNQRLPKFNNWISRVYQVDALKKASGHPHAPEPPFDSDTDWTRPDAPCGNSAAD